MSSINGDKMVTFRCIMYILLYWSLGNLRQYPAIVFWSDDLIFSFLFLDADKEEAESEDELGGLFKILKQKSEHSDRIVINSADCSKFTVQKVKDWEIEEVNILSKKG